QRDLIGTALLGKQRQQLQRRRYLAPRRHHGVSRRDLPCAAKLVRTRLSQAHLLQRGRQGRSLRGVGTAQTIQQRNARGVQIPASIDLRAVRNTSTSIGSNMEHSPTETLKMSEQINRERRRFFGTAAMSIAGAQLVLSGSAEAQSVVKPAAAVKPGSHTSFG